MFGKVNWAMAALFLLAIVVQWNDPDPLTWMAMYAAAFGVSVVVGLRGHAPVWAPLAVLAVAVVWAVSIVGGPAISDYTHMFDAWEMKSSAVEEAREASGLWIVAAWMVVIIVATRTRGRK